MAVRALSSSNVITFVENKQLIGFVLHFFVIADELPPSQKSLTFLFLRASVYTTTSKQSQADFKGSSSGAAVIPAKAGIPPFEVHVAVT
jgi:hypothetical protein